MKHRVAILGAGIGRQHMVGYLALPQHFAVTVVCDLDHAAAADLAVLSPGCRVETEIAQVLTDPAIDIIDICLPPDLHGPVTLQALAAVKHVVCEKPLAGSVREADQMAAAALSSGRLLMPVFQYRYGRGFDQLQALVAADLVGKPLVATLETHWNRDAEYYAIPWRGTWAGERGGAILGHAIHSHDLLSVFFGSVTSVSAMLDTRVNPIETEDCAAIALTTTSGALATSSVTLGAANNTSRFRFVFDRMTAESGREPYAPGQATWQFTARAPTEQAAINTILAEQGPSPDEDIQGYAGQFAALAQRLTGDDSAGVSCDDGVRSIELVAAIYLSARSGQRVSLPLDRSEPVCTDWRFDTDATRPLREADSQ